MTLSLRGCSDTRRSWPCWSSSRWSFWRRSRSASSTADNLLNQGRLMAEVGLVALT